MKKFLGEDFLLSNEVSETLYNNYAKKMPIIDYHCHISPREIAENKRFNNLTEVWLYGDHYKWRQMRSNGIDEKYITGDASDYDKFYKWAETLEKAIGNPLYHWSHLELKRYFGYEGTLSRRTAKEVWEQCNAKLQKLSVRDLITMSQVEVIGTTDDPTDDLRWHKQIADDATMTVKVVPSFRPDKAMNIEQEGFSAYIQQLEEVGERKITSFKDLKEVLGERIAYFDACGCRASDHGLDYIMYNPISEAKATELLQKRLAGEALTKAEVEAYKTTCLIMLAEYYAKKDWVMQLHYGCKRNNNTKMFKAKGPDTGFDCINNDTPAAPMTEYLNHLVKIDALPKTIIYSLNPNDDAIIGSIIGCFQEQGEVCGKLQQGSAWWFNDHKVGMISQMTSLANLGLLGNFIGMLTDSRSFLSYTRHEYFRRILCELIGKWVVEGEVPCDYALLGGMVEDIAYRNAKAYFKF